MMHNTLFLASILLLVLQFHQNHSFQWEIFHKNHALSPLSPSTKQFLQRQLQPFATKPLPINTFLTKTSFPLYMGRAAAVRAQTKSRTDAAKAKNYARFAKKILIAVKAGGADPNTNRQLASVIADAKGANVPKDIITRNIEKGSQGVTADFHEAVYEFYGHGGAGILVNVLTDNEKRALNDISIIAKKHELRSASMNSVAFKFVKRARMDIKGKIDEEKLLEWCLELGVDDFVLLEEINDCPLNPKEENTSVLYVEQKDMVSLRDFLRKQNYELEVKLASVPVDGFIPISEEDIIKNLAAITALETLDDVDNIEHNMDLIFNPEDVQ